MSKQSFTTGQVLTAAQVNSLQANDFNQTVSVKTANYTLAAADKGTRIEFNTSGSVSCTVNSGLFDAGDTLVIQNRGAGTATITAGTATVNTSASLALGQYSAGTLYFVSDSAALFFGDAAGISASIVDAKGDLIVGTADNTVGRLAVGTNGHTLVADSTETTGLKWAAPASGMTLLSTTTLSALSTTISGISGSYKHLVLYSKNLTDTDAGGATLSLRFNGDTGSNYQKTGIRNINNTLNGEQINQDLLVINSRLQTTSTVTKLGSNAVWIYRYTDTDNIDIFFTSYGHTITGSQTCYETAYGQYNGTAAITSITIIGTTSLAGTVYLYGVN